HRADARLRFASDTKRELPRGATEVKRQEQHVCDRVGGTGHDGHRSSLSACPSTKRVRSVTPDPLSIPPYIGSARGARKHLSMASGPNHKFRKPPGLDARVGAQGRSASSKARPAANAD